MSRLLALVCGLIAVLASVSALADGKVYVGLDYSALRYIPENEQLAVIAHRDGVQRMILSISFKATDKDRALWLFPVPAHPEQVRVDLVERFPGFSGRSPHQKARDHITEWFAYAYLTQIWTILGFVALPSYQAYDAQVHEQVDKWGLRIETITARSAEELSGYLAKKGAGLAPAALASFAPYLNDGNTLVSLWISSIDELRKEFPDIDKAARRAGERAPSLYLEFPVPRGFFPLRPSNDGTSQVVPVTLYILGAVRSAESLPAPMREAIALRTYRQSLHSMGPRSGFDERLFKGFDREPFIYTRVKLNASSASLTADLWFEPAPATLGDRYAAAVTEIDRLPQPFAGIFFLCLSVGLAALLSWLSAGMAGLIKYRQWRGYARVGLWNLLTLIGMSMACRYVKGEVGERLRNVAKGETSFQMVFALVFIVLIATVHFLLLLPLS